MNQSYKFIECYLILLETIKYLNCCILDNNNAEIIEEIKFVRLLEQPLVGKDFSLLLAKIAEQHNQVWLSKCYYRQFCP